MAQDWFRKSSWTQHDQNDFRSHLARAKGDNRPQYLRIQAGTLMASTPDLLPAAIELLDEMLRSYPDSLEVATALAQKANCLYRLGDTDGAVSTYAASVHRMRSHPKMLSQDGWINFALIVAKEGIASKYAEAIAVLDEFASASPLLLPNDHFRIHAAKALIALDENQLDLARTHAKRALEAAEQRDSGLPYHASVGLVGHNADALNNRLQEIAA